MRAGQRRPFRRRRGRDRARDVTLQVGARADLVDQRRRVEQRQPDGGECDPRPASVAAVARPVGPFAQQHPQHDRQGNGDHQQRRRMQVRQQGAQHDVTGQARHGPAAQPEDQRGHQHRRQRQRVGVPVVAVGDRPDRREENGERNEQGGQTAARGQQHPAPGQHDHQRVHAGNRGGSGHRVEAGQDHQRRDQVKVARADREVAGNAAIRPQQRPAARANPVPDHDVIPALIPLKMLDQRQVGEAQIETDGEHRRQQRQIERQLPAVGNGLAERRMRRGGVQGGRLGAGWSGRGPGGASHSRGRRRRRNRFAAEPLREAPDHEHHHRHARGPPLTGRSVFLMLLMSFTFLAALPRDHAERPRTRTRNGIISPDKTIQSGVCIMAADVDWGFPPVAVRADAPGYGHWPTRRLRSTGSTPDAALALLLVSTRPVALAGGLPRPDGRGMAVRQLRHPAALSLRTRTARTLPQPGGGGGAAARRDDRRTRGVAGGGLPGGKGDSRAIHHGQAGRADPVHRAPGGQRRG
ncbi:MAG: hypothetical protein BWZ08_02773 [candidate division BRC1 bacterium ADurb.BinA292]|nr:MAG: hypothetical protein BWZ08_02773 [candidate division BRC1 bacterium ADurb.BinA292]